MRFTILWQALPASSPTVVQTERKESIILPAYLFPTPSAALRSVARDTLGTWAAVPVRVLRDATSTEPSMRTRAGLQIPVRPGSVVIETWPAGT